MADIIINDGTKAMLGLDISKDFQVYPRTSGDVLPIKVNTPLNDSYDLMVEATSNRKKNKYFVPDVFPNDNAFIYNEISFNSNIQFAALGSATPRQTQDYFMRYSNLVVFQDTTELFRFNVGEFCNLNVAQEDATLVSNVKIWPWYELPTNIIIEKRAQIRFELQIAPGGLTSANIAAGIPYLHKIFADDTSNGFTVLDVRFRGVMFVQR